MMAENLYPDDLQEVAEEAEEELEDEEELEEEEEEEADDEEAVAQFRESVSFDGEDFQRDVFNRTQDASGVEAYEQWCRVCLATERGTLDLYPAEFGIDMERVREARSFSSAKAILASEIKKALMADTAKRTVSVDAIEFIRRSDDSLEAIITVTDASNAEREIEASFEV